MSKLTIIQLLNKIANGEEVPKKIKYKDYEYSWHDKSHGYCRPAYNCSYICFDTDFNITILNDEVEILEEEKKIPEKLNIEQDTPSSNYYIRNENGTKCDLTKHSKMIAETLNQVIDYLKSKGE